jgi:predicted ATPase
MGTPAPLIRKLAVRNYKSIATCDVSLSPLTVLVGRNGSGKSNFLDAIHFVKDGLQTSLDHAIKTRGGIDAVRRRSTGYPRNFAIWVDFTLADYQLGTYTFEIAARPNGGFAVKSERLEITHANGRNVARYHREEDRVSSASENVMPPVLEDRLYLVNAAGLPQFRGAYDALLSTGFYNLNPEAMKEVQSPDAGELLHGDGSNIASVVARLATQQPETLERIKSYLRTIVPSILTVERTPLGPRETLTFCQEVEGARRYRRTRNSASSRCGRCIDGCVARSKLSHADRRDQPQP